jgi:3-oxoacyl-[acyl-carrier-protein] synthase III
MATYVIHSLDSGGLIVSRLDASCSSDGAALALAKGIIRSGGVAEIWCGRRQLEKVEMPHVP